MADRSTYFEVSYFLEDTSVDTTEIDTQVPTVFNRNKTKTISLSTPININGICFTVTTGKNIAEIPATLEATTTNDTIKKQTVNIKKSNINEYVLNFPEFTLPNCNNLKISIDGSPSPIKYPNISLEKNETKIFTWEYSFFDDLLVNDTIDYTYNYVVTEGEETIIEYGEVSGDAVRNTRPSYSGYVLSTQEDGHNVYILNMNSYGDVFKYTKFSNEYRTITNLTNHTISLFDIMRHQLAYVWDYNLVDINFGITNFWGEDKIRNATLVQEMDRFSNKLSINTLTFDYVDKENEFNPSNINILNKTIKKGQVVFPYEYIDDTRITLGKYIISDIIWTNNIAKFTCTSYLGVLDKVQYEEGELYNGKLAGEVISDILETAGVDEFIISTEIANKRLYGTLKPTTCRNALQQVLFAIHGVVDNTQNNILSIESPSNLINASIKRSQKFSTKVSKPQYVSAIELKYNDYSLGESGELYNNVYDTGEYTIVLSEPCAPNTLTISSNATIINAKPFYITINVITSGEVSISGSLYEPIEKSIVIEREQIDEGEEAFTQTFSTTLCNLDTALDLSDKLFDYYTMATLQIDIKHIAEEIEMNSLRMIDNSIAGLSRYFGVFTKRSFNLTGGFLDNATLIGYFDTQDYFYYATSSGTEYEEMYANDNFLI